MTESPLDPTTTAEPAEPEPPEEPPLHTLQLGERTLTLVRPLHSAVRSRRWLAREEASGRRWDVLLLHDDDPAGPLLDNPDDPSLSGFSIERVSTPQGRAYVFDMEDMTPLVEALEPPPSPEPPGLEALDAWEAAEARRQRRFALVMALGEQVEILHEIAGCLVLHADLSSFVVRQEGERVEVLHRCPELLFARDQPPRAGSWQGTGYDAPEVTGILNREIDARADVFLVGMMAWALLTGIEPGPGAEAVAQQLPLLRAFDPGIPLGVDRCIRRALARTPGERFPSVSAFMDRLRRVWAADEHRQLRGEDRRVWVSWGACSEIGRRKMERYPVNQDAWLELFDPEVGWGLFAVMDGVSRCDIGRGELASWVARTTLEEGWNRKRNAPIYGRTFEGFSPFPNNVLQRLAEQAHDRVYRWLKLLLKDPNTPQSGRALATTLSAVGVFRDRCAVCAIGDSPVYLVRLRRTIEESFIERITVEQTVALTAIRRGVSVADALAMPTASSLSSAIGKVQWKGNPPEPFVAPLASEHCTFRLHPGDILLACSDGIPNAFGREPEEALVSVLHGRLAHVEGPPRETDLTSAARTLVREADARGGRDNLTVVLVSIGPAPGRS